MPNPVPISIKKWGEKSMAKSGQKAGKKRAPKLVQVSTSELKKMKNKIASEEKRKAKKLARKFDGLSPHLIQQLKSACRQVWQRSEARKLCAKRAELPGGYSRCEGCKKKVPKVFIDHIKPVGVMDAGFIDRLCVPSRLLQALCKECHGQKTKADNKLLKSKFSFDNLRG